MVVDEVGRLPSTFLNVAKLTNSILDLSYEFTDGKIVYKFKLVVSYQQSHMPVFSLRAIEASPKLPVYDSLDPTWNTAWLPYSSSPQKNVLAQSNLHV